MRAMVLERPAPIETLPLVETELESPVPGDGEVLIRVTACGVCRSNLHMVEGDWLPASPASLPIVPGHEVVGVVEALGGGVDALTIGQRVGVQPLWSTCGRCELCLSGREHLCRRRQITGETRDGGYAEEMLVDANYAFPIPDELSDAEAAPLMCPGITAFGAVTKAAIQPGHRVAVIGVGGVGHMAVQLAALSGAEVVAVGRSNRHADLAQEIGAHRLFVFGNARDRSAPDEYVDSTLVFAPSDAAVAEALRITKPGGRVVLGVAQDVGRLDIGAEKTVLGSVLTSRADALRVLALAAAGKLRVIKQEFALAEANAALKALKDGRVHGRAVLLPGG